MNANIFGAFSEDQISRLTGLSRAQLSAWRRSGFVQPSYKTSDNPRAPYAFVYSFKDLLTLRVLNQLRNVHGVSLQELKKAGNELKTFGIEDWTSRKLWVFKRRVVFKEPDTEKMREVSSRQYMADIPLEVVTSEASKDIQRLNKRQADKIGVIEKRRQVLSSQPIFSGTRIPVSVVIDYINEGKTNEEIFADFPLLRDGDIKAAQDFMHKKAA